MLLRPVVDDASFDLAGLILEFALVRMLTLLCVARLSNKSLNRAQNVIRASELLAEALIVACTGHLHPCLVFVQTSVMVELALVDDVVGREHIVQVLAIGAGRVRDVGVT